MTRPRILFLPGAGGSPHFWRPVAEALPATWPKEHFGWPGLGAQPHDPAIRGLDDLKRLVTARMDEPVDLVAQSMGGVIAARIALEHPELVRRLVLCVTSGGVDMAGLGASEWRADYRRSFPKAAAWITDGSPTPPLQIEKIAAPTLLIWGDADPISPVAVGRHLEERLPQARLEIVPGGDHDVASTHADLVARLIAKHLT
ncbi:alpha/beta fold hydrolase [Reyranella sp.]|uniref:alpha/beta fold hydrolase n=1 Tax=Reyranella sp. TaxID=1929291 RepID=UPI003C7E4041